MSNSAKHGSEFRSCRRDTSPRLWLRDNQPVPLAPKVCDQDSVKTLLAGGRPASNL